MRIAYCTNVRLPSERAHGHQIAQVCDALVHLGHSVQLFAPYRDNVVSEDYWGYYGAEKSVELTYLGKTDFIKAWWAPGPLGLWSMNAVLRSEYRRHITKDAFDLAYTRSPALLPPLIAAGVPTILELHQLPNRQRSTFVQHCNQITCTACLTNAMRDELVQWGVEPTRLAVEGDAVDVSRFANLPTIEEARQQFGLATDRPVVGYIGRLKTLGMEKGVKYILESVAALKNSHPHFAFIVGGPESDTTEYKEMAESLGLTAEDVLFTGAIPATQVPAALAACDVLAMPFPDFPHYRHHMSPLKMFEYMAANRPLITSDLPTVRDVLSEENAVFCEPGSTDSFAQTLQWIASHPEESAARTKQAYDLVHTRYSWEQRMERVLAHAA